MDSGISTMGNKTAGIKINEIELILGNSNKRFSGVTSTMLQVLGRQKALLSLAVMGQHYVPTEIQILTFWQTAKLCKSTLPDGRYRIFHARRNDEMIQALLLRWLFRAKLKIVFTSTAQRHHSKFTRWLIRKMDGVVSTCDAAARFLERQPDIIVPHGIDTALFCPATDKRKDWQALGLPGKYGIGIFGRVRRQKGIDLLFTAIIPLLKKYPDFTVVITGSVTPDHQEFFDQLMEQANRAGVHQQIVYLGELPFSKIPSLFRAMSIITALSRTEGFGLTVLEAMSSNVAVLTSSAGAWPEIVRNGVDGYTVPNEDTAAISAKLETLMSDPEQLEKMGNNGRTRIEQNYTIEREAQQLIAFFRNLSIAD